MKEMQRLWDAPPPTHTHTLTTHTYTHIIPSPAPPHSKRREWGEVEDTLYMGLGFNDQLPLIPGREGRGVYGGLEMEVYVASVFA